MLKLQQAAEEAAKDMRGPLRGGNPGLGREDKKTPKHRFRGARNAAFLWFAYKGWEGEIITNHLDCSKATFYNFMNKLKDEPCLLFDYPVLSRGVKGSIVVWTCEVCGDKFPKSTEKKAREHVAIHFLPRALVLNLGVFRDWYE